MQHPHTLERLRRGELAGLRRLDLAEDLTDFPPEIFDLADTLEVLNLSHNRLSRLPDDLPRLHRLKVLFASYNDFTELPDVLGACPHLSQVGLRNNRIAHLPAAALPPRLRWLTLTDNALTALPAALGDCVALEKLMLSGNRLTALPASLAGLPALALLRVAANQLPELPGWLADLPALAWVAGAGNPWCDASSVCPAEAPQIPWSALTLQQRLGEGASGVTWQALWQPDAGPARSVAVKLFRGAITSDGLSDSEQAASLSVGPHPQLCSAWARLTAHPQGTTGLVMPLLAADLQALAGPPSLDSCSRDVYAPTTQFSVPQAVRLLREAAQALAHLHAHGVLHGDFYAHNLLWQPTSGTAVLSDLGAALRWPDSAGFAWPTAQRWDVLAFGHLLEEVLERLVVSKEAVALRQRWQPWQTACQTPRVHERPAMCEVAHALAAPSV